MANFYTKKLGSLLVILVLLVGMTNMMQAQIAAPAFGKGITFLGKDSTFYLKTGFRFQSLYNNEWDIIDGKLSDYEANILIRRMRLKFNGWAVSPKLEYKLELALSNRDNAGGSSPEFRNAANIVLDAIVAWNFYKNLTIQFGQTKLPGNRERVISSGDLQFVDRSRLNSEYNIDRDAGFQLKNHHIIGRQFLLREVFALSEGEGRNVTEGHFGGYSYTFRVEALPFGEFQSKGDYVGSAIKREERPKLTIGVSYDYNDNAVRQRGQRGSFFQDSDGNYLGKDLESWFADLMFKYQEWSVMAEFAHRTTTDSNPLVFTDNDILLGAFATGTGLNLAVGYMLPSNWEVAARFTNIDKEEGAGSDEKQYTLGLNRFVVEHKLKIQSDFTYRNRTNANNQIILRFQVDIHF